ncbi:MAG: LysE family translocator [Pseudomonadota bacterium]
MQQDLLTALAVYAFATSMTPGPNNVMLMTSGVNFGFRRTIPHMSGVVIGFAVMIIAVGMGLAGIFYSWPPAHQILLVISVAYLCWLAWRIATQPTDVLAPGEAARPMSLLEAAAFQWVNPKAWTMAVTSVTAYAPDQALTSVLLVALVFGVVNLPAVGSWTLIGLNISRFLGNPRRLRVFNVTMALLLILSLYPVIWS